MPRTRMSPVLRGTSSEMEAWLLSLVVITRNEADRIEDCLASVPWAAERIVVDSGSTDDTVERARRAGARTLVTDWPGHVAQKNRALALATQPWVLSLDADERLSPEALDALEQALARPGRGVAFGFNRCSSWMGRPIRHGRWYPDRKVRVVRRGEGSWGGPNPHDRLEPAGEVRWLDGDILHDPYRSFDEHLHTIASYSRTSADALHAAGVRARTWDVVCRPPLHFVDAYLLRRGFLDGLPGLMVAGLGATHVLCKWGRLRLEPR